MASIRLQRGKWTIDLKRPLGEPGGFGAVYSGSGADHQDVAIKKLNIDAVQAARREIRIADDFIGKKSEHIIPVFDAGLDAESDSYYIVMARADRSLHDYLREVNHLPELESVAVLISIATGLAEAAAVVHRDLKPHNVLFHDGKWKIADFGIARFVEESTSSNTLRNCLTAAFGAPEQWKSERSTNATDIYALGCIAHSLFRGSPPFYGPTNADFRQQHLFSEPPELGVKSRIFESIVLMMLRKLPTSRPSLKRVLGQLDRIVKGNVVPEKSSAEDQLQNAAAEFARQKTGVEARESLFKEEQKERQSIATEGYGILAAVIARLFSAIENVVVDVAISPSERNPSLQAGPAALSISYFTAPGALPRNLFPTSGWDVVAGVTIQLTQAQPPYTWGSCIWYINQGDGSYRWTEVGYMKSPLIPDHLLAEPFPLRDFGLADKAVGPIMAEYQCALGPTLIDDEDEQRFQNRWKGLFAQALTGRLQRPSRLPVDV